MQKSATSYQSRECCPTDYSNDNLLFFSLVDYKNNYFISNNPNKIVEFYDSFENRDQLTQWMKERPNGTATIIEVDGDKEIIVVIPTPDFNGKYAKECRENVFKGLHIIFVESGEFPDPYFNYAHNCNVGIRKAMEYNPKWVVVSNDDITSTFSPEYLINELSKIDYNTFNIVLTKGSRQSATKTSVCKFSKFGIFIYSVLSYIHLIRVVDKKHEIFLMSAKLNMALGNKYFVLGNRKSFFNLFIKRIYSYYNFEAFGIFSSGFINNISQLFDETYINAHEDQDVSIVLSKEPIRISWINYRIEGVGGISMGNNLQRGLRTIASDCYLNFKIEQGLLINIK